METDPVLFSNDTAKSALDIFGASVDGVSSSSSVKDAVRFSSGNNLMGLICPSSLLVFPFPSLPFT